MPYSEEPDNADIGEVGDKVASACGFAYSSTMPKAFVRRIQGDKYLHLCFKFQSCSLGIDEYITVVTGLSDTISDLLQTVSDSITDRISVCLKSGKKLEAQHYLNSLCVDIYGSEYPISLESECLDLPFWYGEEMFLKITDVVYNVALNAPCVDVLVLPRILMVGFPVYPFKLKISFANLEDCVFRWYRNGNDSECIGNGYYYTPTSSDVGRKLKLVCIPGNGEEQGPQAEVVSRSSVISGPGKCPFEDRHIYTSHSTEAGSFRVMTYNILADFNVAAMKKHRELFPHCNSFFLDINYRKQLIFKEILGYNSDIICLQEVDKPLYEHELSSFLAKNGYDGRFRKKANHLTEGVACFFKKSKFVLHEHCSFALSQELQIAPCLGRLWKTLRSEMENLSEFLKRPTPLQVLVLGSVEDSEQYLLIANTHLRSWPDPDYIRLLQAGVAISYIEYMVSKFKIMMPGKKLAVVFCGDFNSTPDRGVYELMTQQIVTSHHPDWTENENENVKGVNLTHRLKLDSACGTPSFTNYTHDYIGCLDYIFYQKDALTVSQVVPLPSLEAVKRDVALPSEVFPSDHLALVADLQWL